VAGIIFVIAVDLLRTRVCQDVFVWPLRVKDVLNLLYSVQKLTADTRGLREAKNVAGAIRRSHKLLTHRQ